MIIAMSTAGKYPNEQYITFFASATEQERYSCMAKVINNPETTDATIEVINPACPEITGNKLTGNKVTV